MTPRADFTCLSKHCATDEGATVYELPVDASHCPRGHKRLRRLFNQVNVLTRPAAPDIDYRLTSNSHLARSNALLQDGFDHAAAIAPPPDMMRAQDAMMQQYQGQPIGTMLGRPGTGAPMLPLEIQREIAKDRGRGLSPLPALRAMNREPIPTIAHRDPRGE
jgi:hypothetical protein